MRSTNDKRKFAAFVFGLSFYWVFLRRSYFGLLLASHSGAGPSSQMYYFVFLVAATGLAAVAIAQHKRFTSILSAKPQIVVATSLLAAIGGLLVFASPSFSLLVIPVSVLGIVAISTNFLVLTFAWGFAATQERAKTAILCMILSFIISFCISFLLLMPFPTPIFITIAAPLVSGVLWYHYPKRTGLEDEHTFCEIRQLPLGLIGLLVFFLLTGGFMRGLVYSGDINYIPSGDSILPHLISMSFALMMFLLVFFSRQREQLFYSIWIILTTLFFAGLFSVALLNEEWSAIGNGVLISGRTCLSFFLWITLANAIRTQRLSPIIVFGCFFVLTEMLSAFLSYFIVPTAAHALGVSFDSYTTFFSIGMALILIAASFLLLNNKAFGENGSGGEYNKAMPRIDSWQSACDSVTIRFGLTKREAEVMFLVSKGHSKSKIAEMLFVSEGTIQTHTKSIYKKLDLHSRQELIDLVAKKVET